jgi:hypothetical protein
MTNVSLWTCPRGCDAVMEYVGVDDGFGLNGNLCCDVYECPICGGQERKDCFNCEDDEEFGDKEHQIEERHRRNL